MLYVEGIDVTPNPNAIKFILNEQLLQKTGRNYKSASEADNDPFAKGIFEIPGVVSVFYMDRFVTIEKTNETVWGELQKLFARFISEFDKNLIPAEEINSTPVDQTEILKQITDLLEYRVKPALAADGGGLEIIGFEGLTLSIRYQGACGSCPSAIRGTLVAIENLLRRDIHPEINVIPG